MSDSIIPVGARRWYDVPADLAQAYPFHPRVIQGFLESSADPRVRGLTEKEKRVFIALASFWDGERGRGAFPGEERLASEAKCCIRHLRRIIGTPNSEGTLIEKGFIRPGTPHRGSKGQKLRTFDCALELDEKGGLRVPSSPEKGGLGVPKEGTPCPKRGDSESPDLGSGSGPGPHGGYASLKESRSGDSESALPDFYETLAAVKRGDLPGLEYGGKRWRTSLSDNSKGIALRPADLLAQGGKPMILWNEADLRGAKPLWRRAPAARQ